MFHTFSFLSCHFSSSSFFFFFLTFLFASCFFCFFCSREREREKRAVSHKEFLSQKKEKKLAKLYHKPTTYFSNPLKPSPRIQKKQKPLTRAKKCCVPRWKVAFSTLTCEGSPGGNSLAVLYRRYCVELKVYG